MSEDSTHGETESSDEEPDGEVEGSAQDGATEDRVNVSRLPSVQTREGEPVFKRSDKQRREFRDFLRRDVIRRR